MKIVSEALLNYYYDKVNNFFQNKKKIGPEIIK